MGKETHSKTEKETWFEEALIGTSHWKTTISDGEKTSKGLGRTPEESQRRASDNYHSSNEGGSGSGGGCFLTTACVQWAGLPDDCEILQEFRHFRDEYMMKDEDMSKLVQQYYRLSPLIVIRIERDPNKNEVLKQLYNDGILPAFSKIKSGDLKGAVALYSDLTRQLAGKYNVSMN